jgi:hypothetical protein
VSVSDARLHVVGACKSVHNINTEGAILNQQDYRSSTYNKIWHSWMKRRLQHHHQILHWLDVSGIDDPIHIATSGSSVEPDRSSKRAKSS